MQEHWIAIDTDAWNIAHMRKAWLSRDAKTKVLTVNVLWVGNDTSEAIIADNVKAGQFESQFMAWTGRHLSVAA